MRKKREREREREHRLAPRRPCAGRPGSSEMAVADGQHVGCHACGRPAARRARAVRMCARAVRMCARAVRMCVRACACACACGRVWMSVGGCVSALCCAVLRCAALWRRCQCGKLGVLTCARESDGRSGVCAVPVTVLF